MNNRRRNFRSRPQKNNFRRRSGGVSSNNNIYNNGNRNFSRNGFSNNIHTVEKAMQKFQQLAKDAQSSGDPVLAENYLQHADHYLRRFNELSLKNKADLSSKPDETEKSSNQENISEKDLIRSAN